MSVNIAHILQMDQCLRETMLSFDGRAPRYTSYPTAPHFQDMSETGQYVETLQTLPENAPISLYLHVPFCKQMCWYCGCHTKATRRYDPVEDYVGLLIQEIDLLADTLNPSHNITNIHFGGGSPGILKAKDFECLMEKLRARFKVSDRADIALELDPRGVTEDHVKAYADCGVTRISLGVQDFDETVLAAINRPQPFEVSNRAISLIRKHGINKINIDVMYGLPHQTLETLQATLGKLMMLDPDRIAFFGYAHVPWMKKHMRLIDEGALPDKDLRFDLFHAGQDYFLKAGYIPVGIDHFAKPEDSLVQALQTKILKRNFQGYTDDQSEILIGLGVSSIGKLHDCYIQNHVGMPPYKDKVLNCKVPVHKICAISPDDRLRAAIIEQLMCYLEVDLSDICKAHGQPLSYFNNELQKLSVYEKLEFIDLTKSSNIKIYPEVKIMTRIICSVFDAYYQQSTQDIIEKPRHARAI